MKHVLKVLNTFIGQKKDELERKDAKIKELWNENFELKNEVKVLRNDLAELSKEHFKK
jgi:regulator of replication initiation timing